MNKNTKESNSKASGSHRQNMVASTIHRVVATAIIAKNISAPGLKAEIISVMDVKMSPDLKQARVFISMIGGEDENQQQLKIMQSLSQAIQLLIARNLNLRYAPKVSIVLDNSVATHIRIEELLTK